MTSGSPSKLAFIRAYFDELERKIAVLTALADEGFKDEALTLCLVYVDGLAQRLAWPSDKAGFNYVTALAQFGQDVELGMVHPKQLADALDRMKAPWHPIASAVRAAFPGPTFQLLPAATVVASLTSLLPNQALLLQDEVWRGTVAGVAYFRMRNPAIHALGASTLSFGATSFRGKPAKSLELRRLQSAARHLAAEARRRSEAAGEWFGSDAIVA